MDLVRPSQRDLAHRGLRPADMGIACLFFLAAPACSASSSAGANPSDTQDAAAEAQPPDGATGGADSTVPDAPAGSSITGSVQGKAFTTAATALWLGAPDSAATTVVYVFSAPVTCADLQTPGWDTRIPAGTQVLEMKAFGTSPGAFQVVKSANPASGEASVNYTLSSTSSPTELSATTGTVTLPAIDADVRASGSFSLQFQSDTLDGTFDAAFCAGGHEP